MYVGPMFYNGYYHLFYQYNPKGSVWGNIIWAHSVSKDLINWEGVEPAIYPSKPFDKYGCWSGSATIVPDKGPIILYTGIVDEKNTQVQVYAIPEDINDPFLRKWVKPDEHNPVVIAEKGVNGSAFRDPTTAWKDKSGHWKILVGSRRKHRGVAYLYRSRDFKKWVRAKHPIHSAAKTGMWECPDFYPVLLKGKEGLDTSIEGDHVKHVLKSSLDMTRFEYYTLGKYNSDEDKYVPSNTSEDGWGGLRYDYDVEVTFSFASLEKAEDFDPSWVNAQDLCSLKGSEVQGGLGPFGLLTLASENLQEFTPVFFRVFKAPNKHVVLLCSDAKR
ncbi:hypothetical protein TSUD_339750 [Trifolium subterraneum]|nr:hypothetical protein TSUD_339750 [Trifolium subterraneum]